MKLNWEKLSPRRYYAKCGPLRLNVIQIGSTNGKSKRWPNSARWITEENPFIDDFETPEQAMAGAEKWFEWALAEALAVFRAEQSHGA